MNVAPTIHTRTSCERPKVKVITKTNSGVVSRRQHSNDNVRCCKTVVVSYHARCHLCSPPGYARKHLARGLCNRFAGNCDFSINRRTMPPEKTWCRTDYHARPIKSCRSLYLILRDGFSRTTYEQASSDDFSRFQSLAQTHR